MTTDRYAGATCDMCHKARGVARITVTWEQLEGAPPLSGLAAQLPEFTPADDGTLSNDTKVLCMRCMNLSLKHGVDAMEDAILDGAKPALLSGSPASDKPN